MPHSLIIGMSESGKTTLAKQIAQEFYENGTDYIVYDPITPYQSAWPGAAFVTDDIDELYAIAKHPDSRNLLIIIDESSVGIGRNPQDKQWFATQARHWGHTVLFLAQREVQVSVTVRDQCTWIYIFRIAKKDAEKFADEFGHPVLKEAHQLGKLEFFKLSRYDDPEIFHLTFE